MENTHEQMSNEEIEDALIDDLEGEESTSTEDFEGEESTEDECEQSESTEAPRTYQKQSDYQDILEYFWRFYVSEMERKTPRKSILLKFRTALKEEKNREFNPYPQALKRLCDRIEKKEAQRKIPYMPKTGKEVTAVQAQFTTAKAKEHRVKPFTLEDGATSLAESLILDATRMLEDLNSSYEDGFDMDAEMKIKKKNHVLNVFRHIGTHVQRGQMIELKRRKEGRESASFILDLITKSQAGALSEDDMELIKSGVTGVIEPSS